MRRPVHRLSRGLRIVSILLGFAVSGISGAALLTGRDGVFALVAKLFYPGLFAALLALRGLNTNTIIMAFLLNAIFYLLLFFFFFRWRAGRQAD